MAENKACRRAPTTVTASVFVILAACSSGGGGTAGTTGAGTTGGGTTGGTAGSTYGGSVILSNVFVSGASRFSALAAFDAYNNTVCPGGTQLGNCCYEPPPATTTTGGTPTLVSAGNITVADNGSTLGTLTFASTPIPGYTPLSSTTTSTLTWASGDSLTVTAAGATVDAFNGTVKAPGLISGVNPALSSTMTIPLTSSWSVSWTPDTQSGESMIVNLLDDTLHSAITCTAQDSAGTVSFPASLLSHFTSTDSARVALSRSAATAPSDGNTAVNVLAGVNVAGTGTFQ
jgi:hypothetical protein